MRISAKRQPDSLENMMDDDRMTNAWVESGSLSFYVRKGRITTRKHNATYIKPCLMVANFNVRRHGKSVTKQHAFQMIGFMKEIETNALRFGYAGVFVECVYNARLRLLLPRFGYRLLPGYAVPCYFKPATSILRPKRGGSHAALPLQSPSLRRFLRTPGVDRFWLRDQKRNLVMHVRRERMGSAPFASRLRLTILDVYRYKAGDSPDGTGHGLYWSDDESDLLRFLGNLESRLEADGIHELAVCATVAGEWAMTPFGGGPGRTPDRDASEDRMCALGYVRSPGAGGWVYLKALREACAAASPAFAPATTPWHGGAGQPCQSCQGSTSNTRT